MALVKLVAPSKTNSSMLPLGKAAVAETMRVVRVPFGSTVPAGGAAASSSASGGAVVASELQHSVMAVLNTNPSNMNSAELLLQSNVAGFVYCQGVDAGASRMFVLAPCPGPLPSKVLLLGSLKWFDQM